MTAQRSRLPTRPAAVMALTALASVMTMETETMTGRSLMILRPKVRSTSPRRRRFRIPPTIQVWVIPRCRSRIQIHRASRARPWRCRSRAFCHCWGLRRAFWGWARSPAVVETDGGAPPMPATGRCMENSWGGAIRCLPFHMVTGGRMPQATPARTSSVLWQATPRPATSRTFGISFLQRSITKGQRVWKRQPDGGFRGDGSSPFRTIFCARSVARTLGVEVMSARV